MTGIVGGNRRKRKREKEKEEKRRHKVTQTRHRKVAEHVGTVKYVVVKDKKVEKHTAAVLVLEQGTIVAHNRRNSHRNCIRHEACIVENMLSHRLNKTEQRVKERHGRHTVGNRPQR